jgi:NADH-quinone oxidoreductase subunit M
MTMAILWMFIVPFIASAVLLALPTFSGKFLKRLAFLLSLIPLAILLINHSKLIGMELNVNWIPSLSIAFFLKIDALSLVFLYLTAVIIPISILAVDCSTLSSPGLFYFFVLLLEGLLIGFFMARDLALFTIFWEAMLLPLYFIINYWGGEQRHQAALKFLVYMIGGSVLMIAAILFLYFTASGSFNLDALQGVAANAKYAGWILAIFMLAFAVKTPLFPFHAWLPDAYYQAPTSGTILLSAILSKAGIYGILRIGIELFPKLLQEWSPVLLGLAIAGVFYGGLAAWMQNDFKRLIAYSSFSHVNFILAGLFIWQQPAQAGAVLQAVNHSITIAALFLTAGWLENFLKTTSMGHVRGLAKYLPNLCWLTLFFVLSNVALPGTNNFIGEVMIFFGLFGQSPWITAFLGLSIILSVIYMLRYMQNIYFGAPVPSHPNWIDIGAKELLIAAPLVALILWIGIYPAPVLNEINKIAVEEHAK